MLYEDPLDRLAPPTDGAVRRLGTLLALPSLHAEIEFESAEESGRFSPPKWFGDEVTNDKHYKNSGLALHGKCYAR
jgi:CYTH domain-containing protein